MMRVSPSSFKTGFAAAMLALGLAGCSQQMATNQLDSGILPPVDNPITEINQSLRDLPPPSDKVVAAVYDYADQTGQFKPSDVGQTLSRAVTQGATSVLIKALQDVGDGGWFTVVEREKVANLLKERQIITQMRSTYLGETQINPQALPPLLFAAIIFEGGIIGFDSNTQTGGIGAGLLGISADAKYRLDTITVYLRAVSTKTGQVLASVTTHKTIASVGVRGGVFKYVSFDEILEAEAGITKNEPDQLAVQQAIEKAVYTMVIEGAERDIWSFDDKIAQDELIRAKNQARTRTSSLKPNAVKSGPDEKFDTQTEVVAAPPLPDKTSGWVPTQVANIPGAQNGEDRARHAEAGAASGRSNGVHNMLMSMN